MTSFREHEGSIPVGSLTGVEIRIAKKQGVLLLLLRTSNEASEPEEFQCYLDRDQAMKVGAELVLGAQEL